MFWILDYLWDNRLYTQVVDVLNVIIKLSSLIIFLLLSWLLLGAKCRSCKKKISITYPLIELTTGLLFCANFFAYPSIYSQLPKTLIIFSGTIFSSILIVLSILDCKYFWVAKNITFGGLTLSLILSWNMLYF